MNTKNLAGFFATLTLLTTSPANALMLQGSVNQDASGGQAANSLSGQSQMTPVAAPQARMAPETSPLVASALKTERRARAMQGNWLCTTQVVSSTTPGVSPGTIVKCQVQYSRDAKGNLLESWSEDGWTPSTAAAVKLDSDVITVSHTSSYPSNGFTINVQSTDAIKLVAPDTIIARGFVNQFQNGKFVGQYKTASVLRRAA